MTDTDVHALSGAYALDAVNDIERAAFARHLGACETCAIEVAEFHETTARLAEEAGAPPGMRDAVLARVRQTRQVGPGRPERAEGVAALSRWRRRTAIAVAAGMLVAGAGAASYVVQEQRVRDQREVAEAARTEAARIEAVLAAPDAVLTTKARPGGGRVTLAYSNVEDAAVAVLADMPPPGPGRAYQLWMIDESGATNAGVLATGATEDRRLVTGVRGATDFGVTNEPAGGSREPTPPAFTVPL
jgi:anti-sigma factor RsiW